MTNINLERERLTYVINRIDGYLEQSNTKASVMIGISTFITSALFGVLMYNTSVITECIVVTVLLVLSAILTVAIYSLLIFTIHPYTKSSKISLYFFRDISNMSKAKFNDMSTSCNTIKDTVDLREQVYLLSKGCSRKYQKLSYSSYLIFSLLIVGILIISLLLKHSL